MAISEQQRNWLQGFLGLGGIGPAQAAPPGGTNGRAAPGNGAAPGDGDPAKLKRNDASATPKATAPKPGNVADMDAKWKAAVAGGDWAAAAEVVNGFSAADMQKRLAPLSMAEVAKVHAGALSNKKVGPKSAVALATTAVEHPIMSGGQAERAEKLKGKLSARDQKKLKAALDSVPTKEGKEYVTKGLSAGHSVAELEKFAKKIAGKDAKWMQDNLSLTGNSQGKGVKQQWETSCNATSVEAVRAEFDPIYALKMHEDNPNLTEANDSKPKEMNPKLAADQKKMLQSKYKGSLGKMDGGVAQARDKGGVGRFADDLLNKSSKSTGVSYKTEIIGDGATLDTAVTDINDGVSKGVPVPIIIGNQKNPNQTTSHYVVVTATDPGPPRAYLIHDPWEGKTYRRSEEQLKSGHLDIAGWNDLGGVEKPTIEAVK